MQRIDLMIDRVPGRLVSTPSQCSSVDRTMWRGASDMMTDSYLAYLTTFAVILISTALLIAGTFFTNICYAFLVSEKFCFTSISPEIITISVPLMITTCKPWYWLHQNNFCSLSLNLKKVHEAPT